LIADKKLTFCSERAPDWLGIPFIKDGSVIGMMAVQRYEKTKSYNDNDLNLLIFSAPYIVNVMSRLQENKFLYNAVNASTRDLMKKIRECERSE
jgi:signal transduction protein with GAF and PtsI domain